MGGFRFVFRRYKEYIFAILSDSSASLLFVQSRLLTLTEIFEEFIRSNEVDEYQEIQNAYFDDQINNIISGKEEMRTSQPLYRKIVELITNLVFENEILGAALFSINGNVIYSSLPQEILLSSLKELEIRHAVASDFSTTFYSLENGQKIFSKVIEIPWKLDPLILVVLFDSTTVTGMAEVNLDKMSKTIQNII
ncbi:MAG: hypothetical protein EU533_01970 [Promethearchaeota archaeon]|nr:MAG: hypothetical protein EU533_01970 [Candidatus Lokiarchaeota archaeon]